MPNLLRYRVTGLGCIVLVILLTLCQSNVFAGLTVIIGPATVVDGDTLKIMDFRIRLQGIDAPELRQSCHDKVTHELLQCGITAKLKLSARLNELSVTCYSRNKDRYGRYVAECQQGETDINAWLVENGWALDWPYYSHGAYASEQAAAKKSRAGIWAFNFMEPWLYRKKSKR